MSNNDKEKAAGIVIAAIIIIAFVIKLCQSLFPFFFYLTALSLLVLIILLIIRIFNPDEWEWTIELIVLAVFGSSLILTFVTYGIGYGFGKSDVGTAITDTADALNTISEIEKNATMQIIDVGENVTQETMNQAQTDSLTKGLMQLPFKIMRLAVG